MRECVRVCATVCALVIGKFKQLPWMRDHGLQTHHVDQADFSHEIEIYHRLSTKYSLRFGLHSSLVATSDYAHAVVITACRCQDHLPDIS